MAINDENKNNNQDMMSALNEELERRLNGKKSKPSKIEKAHRTGGDKPPISRRRKLLLRIIILLFLLLAGVVAVVVAVTRRKPAYDRNATVKSDSFDEEKKRAELQDAANSSNFRVMINTAPVTDADGNIDWCIMNSVENSYNMQVVITTTDGTQLYESNVLVPGGEVLTDKPVQNMPAGTYPALAVVYALDRTTGDILGQVEVDIVLTVK